MRILGGNSKGRRFPAPEALGLRPISGRIKKSLFDILKEVVPGARVLDLFAGSGAVGMEALSRGAAFVFLVEKNPRFLEALRRNLEGSGFSAKALAHPGDALQDLSWIPFRAGVSAFDIVFLGPPYKSEDKAPLAYSTPALARVMEAAILSPGAVVVCQHHAKEKVQAPSGLEVFRREKYGDTFLLFLRPFLGQGG